MRIGSGVRGTPRRVLEQCVRNLLGNAIAVSQEILTEVRRVLVVKFPAFEDDFDDPLVALQCQLVWIRLGSLTVTRCPDDDDNHILATAVLGRAAVVVSGDRDLVDLGSAEMSGSGLGRPIVAFSVRAVAVRRYGRGLQLALVAQPVMPKGRMSRPSPD